MNTSRPASWRRGAAYRLSTLAAVPLAMAFGAFESKGQALRPDESSTAQGLIRNLTTAPMGERDGAILDDGTVIHWPPDLADRFSAVAGRGDRVRVSGRMETGPEGDTHLEVKSITNLRTNASAENDFGPPPPPPGRRRRPGLVPPPPRPLGRRGPLGSRVGESRSAEGRVQSITTAPMGEVDGAVLDDGTVIHWPPHVAERFTGVIARGDRIKVIGWMETGPAGDTHLEVQTAINVRTNQTVGPDASGPPAGPGHVAPNGSDVFVAPTDRPGDVDRRIEELEGQIDRLRAEVERLRRER